jgi:hypothetical protein
LSGLPLSAPLEHGNFGSKDEFDSLRRDKDMLLNELVRMRQNQELMFAEMHEMRRRQQVADEKVNVLTQNMSNVFGFLQNLFQHHPSLPTNLRKRPRGSAHPQLEWSAGSGALTVPHAVGLPTFPVQGSQTTASMSGVSFSPVSDSNSPVARVEPINDSRNSDELMVSGLTLEDPALVAEDGDFEDHVPVAMDATLESPAPESASAYYATSSPVIAAAQGDVVADSEQWSNFLDQVAMQKNYAQSPLLQPESPKPSVTPWTPSPK